MRLLRKLHFRQSGISSCSVAESKIQAQRLSDLFFNAAPHLESIFQVFELSTKPAFAQAPFNIEVFFLKIFPLECQVLREKEKVFEKGGWFQSESLITREHQKEGWWAKRHVAGEGKAAKPHEQNPTRNSF